MDLNMSINLETAALITEKSKTKKDGVYRFRGAEYRVKDGRATHYAINGEILEKAYGFVCVVGNYDWEFSTSNGTKMLKAIK
jgi:hypothetical protein